MTPETILVRARNLVLRLDDAESVFVMLAGERLAATPHALLVLHAFAHPRTVAEVLSVIASGPEHWIEISSTVLQLYRTGVLVESGVSHDPPQGYERPTIHAVMLDDHARTRGFVQAIHQLVTPNDVVLDIGTGTGILATAAALAGARVHAIEASRIADAAEKVFAVNRVIDHVTLHRGRSTQVALPERATVLVTEMIGNDPLDENMLEIVADAKTRLLVEGARLIPSAIEIVAVPVDIPRRVFERHVFTAGRLEEWRAMYGVDLSPLLSVRPTASQPMMVKTADVLAWPRVAPPVSVATIDFAQPFDLTIRSRVSVLLKHDVERLGVLLAFRATLAPGIVLTTLLDAVDPANHWRYGLWPSIDQPSFPLGTEVTIDYAHDRGTTTISMS